MRQLIYYRKLRGRTQLYIAKEIGVTCQQYSKYENGNDRVSIPALYAIAGVLEVSIFDLLSDKVNEPSRIGQLFFTLWNKQDDHNKSLLLAFITSMEKERENTNRTENV